MTGNPSALPPPCHVACTQQVAWTQHLRLMSRQRNKPGNRSVYATTTRRSTWLGVRVWRKSNTMRQVRVSYAFKLWIGKAW